MPRCLKGMCMEAAADGRAELRGGKVGHSTIVTAAGSQMVRREGSVARD